MKNYKNLGRVVGVGMLTSFVVGMLSNFKLQADLFTHKSVNKGTK